MAKALLLLSFRLSNPVAHQLSLESRVISPLQRPACLYLDKIIKE